MALVIPFRPPNEPRRDVITFYERMLERARKGEIQGVVSVMAISNAEDEIAVCGEFLDNPTYALNATRVGLDCLALKDAGDQGKAEAPSRRKQH
jgi:hypothetical protein